MGDRIAVRFAYEYRNDSGTWFRAYGNPNGKVPVLVDDVDGERFALTESAAILVYLAERSPSPRHASPMRPNASSVFSMRSLADQAFAAGDDFTIADIAHFGWLWRRQFPGRTLDERPNLTRWYDDVAARPAVQLAIAGGEALVPGA